VTTAEENFLSTRDRDNNGIVMSNIYRIRNEHELQEQHLLAFFEAKFAINLKCLNV
jgi:hypothetical protein